MISLELTKDELELVIDVLSWDGFHPFSDENRANKVDALYNKFLSFSNRKEVN